jgi:hypothetical protein
MNAFPRSPSSILLVGLLSGCCPFLAGNQEAAISKYEATAPVDDRVLAGWVQSDSGMDALALLVSDPARPIELRVAALIAATRANQGDRVGTLLRELATEDAAGVSAKAIASIASLLGQDEVLTAAAKRALLGASPKWPDGAEAVLGWALGTSGDSEISAESAKQALARLTPEERQALGKARLFLATTLLRFDLEPEASLAELVAALGTDPDVEGFLAAALHERFRDRAASAAELAAVGKLTPPKAVPLGLEVATGRHHPPEIRAAAAEKALELAPSAGPESVEGLVRLAALGGREVKWKAAMLAVRLSKGTALDQALGALRADASKGPPELDSKGMLDLCVELRESGAGDAAVATLVTELAGTDLTVRATSVVCLKVLMATSAVPDLKAIAKLKQKDDGVLAPFAGGETTLAKLAQNAIEGIAMKPSILVRGVGMSQLQPELDFIDRELLATGAAYKKAVAERVQEWKAKHP